MTGLEVMGLLLAHFVGDYILQSHWMAVAKTSRWVPALIHAGIYTACHVPVTQSPLALLVIGGTHAIIDRYRLARHLIWIRDHGAPKSLRPKSWEQCKSTGQGEDVPVWMAVWLMIIADNTVHLLINTTALVLL